MVLAKHLKRRVTLAVTRRRYVRMKQMAMKTLTEELHGGLHAEKLERLKKALREIEATYIDWFKVRPHPIDKHDRLENHIRTSSTGQDNEIKFSFIDNDVPKVIQDECYALFRNLFPTSKKASDPR